VASEKVRLRIGNLAKAVLVTGQAYQEPKDALNEFISNAADEYALSGRGGERIRVVLRRKGRYPIIAIDDNGRGMPPDRLREVARNLFESVKVGDDRTLGEKAIGLLAFQQLAGRCDIVSRAEDSEETWALRLQRGKATATLERERRRARQTPGTTVYLADLDPEVLRVLTQRKVVEYLRLRRGVAIARGDYEIEVVEGRTPELVTPDRPDGVRLAIPPHHTLWGRLEFEVYVTNERSKRHRVAVVGRAGTTIIDDITELDEFDDDPWASGYVSGMIGFPALQQSAGRRAILRDSDAFPVFVDGVRTVEAPIREAVQRIARALDEQTADRLSDTVRRIFGKVLKELADLENPMRASLTGGGDGPGDGLQASPDGDESLFGEPSGPNGDHAASSSRAEPEPPSVDELTPDPVDPVPPSSPASAGEGQRRRNANLPSLAPDPTPGNERSRFDEAEGVVLYNESHTDYLLVKDSEPALLDYLATLVAKEYVVYNNPRSAPADLGEELVRMLVRVRRHLPRRT
jgi:hypothetical protein